MQLEGFKDISEILRSGVYVLILRSRIVYIGKSKNLYARIYSHRYAATKEKRGVRLPSFMPKGIQFDEVQIFPARLDQLDVLERAMIAKYRPQHNTMLKPPLGQPLRLVIGSSTLTIAAKPPRPQFERRV